MPIQVVSIPVTTDASGAGTATTRAIRGEIVKLRAPLAATAITAAGGTTDWTFVDSHNGSTVLSLTNTNAPWERHPGVEIHNATGGTAGTALWPGSPVGGTVTMTVAAGQPSKSGTVFLYLRT